jgi:glycosyltransferase involved in cell wall biosynthesis
MKNSILFLNENPLPKVFTKGTISGKELRLRAACEFINEVHAVALPGRAVETGDAAIGVLEKKIVIHQTIRWPYYLSPVILFGYGFYYAWNLKPKMIEAESPILSGVAAVVLGKLFRIPVLVEVRASYDQLIKMKLPFIPLQFKKVVLDAVQMFVFSHANVVVANSKTYQKEIKKMGFEAVVINPGLQYPPKKINLEMKKKIIGYLGRLVQEKGVDYLLRACKSIEKDLVKDGWSIEIAGDGPERKNLENLALQLFKDSKLKVKFLGFVNNYEALSRFSILVNPCYLIHPLEMVNVEAAYMHVPVVCFGTKEVPETVLNGKTGVKVRGEMSEKNLGLGIKKILNGETSNNQFEKLEGIYSFVNQNQKYFDTVKNFIN